MLPCKQRFLSCLAFSITILLTSLVFCVVGLFMPREKLLQKAPCTCSFRLDTSKILEIDTWLTGFITDFKQSNKLICCAKQSPQETFSRDATALWFLSWDEICVIISIIMNEWSCAGSKETTSSSPQDFLPGQKKKQNYVNNKWCERLCEC